MGSLTFLLIISVVSYLVYYTYKEVTRPLSSSLKDDIKKIKDDINASLNDKINKNANIVFKIIIFLGAPHKSIC